MGQAMISPSMVFRFTIGKAKWYGPDLAFGAQKSAVGAVWHGYLFDEEKHMTTNHRPNKESACKCADPNFGVDWRDLIQKISIAKTIFPTSSNWTPG